MKILQFISKNTWFMDCVPAKHKTETIRMKQ